MGSYAQALARLPILFYRYMISPLLPGACRFHPSCSDYALQAVDKHGAGKGLILAFKRLARCHPWGDHGHDPVP